MLISELECGIEQFNYLGKRDIIAEKGADAECNKPFIQHM